MADAAPAPSNAPTAEMLAIQSGIDVTLDELQSISPDARPAPS